VKIKYNDGVPCGHPGCLNHVTHPCEGCGRVGGVIDKKQEDLVTRLKKRAEIRRQIPGRKSVQEGKPDRIAALLEEAAARIEDLHAENTRLLKRLGEAALTIDVLSSGLKKVVAAKGLAATMGDLPPWSPAASGMHRIAKQTLKDCGMMSEEEK
jgi:hypothetical protein